MPCMSAVGGNNGMGPLVFFGLLLGYGAAVPIGPMNLELIRRNLLYGYKVGVSFGCGACCVDATYIVLLGQGALLILANPLVLKGVAFFGALILFWFAYKAYTCQVTDIHLQQQTSVVKPCWRHFLDSYVLTFINPFTIIFWSSVSSEAVLLMTQNHHAFWVLAFSVFGAAFSWILGLNTLLHFTRHKISVAGMKRFNKLGALLLTGFALFGLIKVFA